MWRHHLGVMWVLVSLDVNNGCLPDFPLQGAYNAFALKAYRIKAIASENFCQARNRSRNSKVLSRKFSKQEHSQVSTSEAEANDRGGINPITVLDKPCSSKPSHPPKHLGRVRLVLAVFALPLSILTQRHSFAVWLVFQSADGSMYPVVSFYIWSMFFMWKPAFPKWCLTEAIRVSPACLSEKEALVHLPMMMVQTLRCTSFQEAKTNVMMTEVGCFSDE